jgi:histidinol-phosphate/aromatic aminotransferase/cobyric acid decarboxylase-like protein
MGFPKAIRVSVGTEAENEKFLAGLAAVHGPSARAPEAQLKGKRG